MNIHTADTSPYKPETQWIGGLYPGSNPPSVPTIVRKDRTKPTTARGHKRKAIVDYVRRYGPVPSVRVAAALGQQIDSVRIQLRYAFQLGLVAREERKHPTRNNRILFYSGVTI